MFSCNVNVAVYQPKGEQVQEQVQANTGLWKGLGLHCGTNWHQEKRRQMIEDIGGNVWVEQ